MLKNLIVLPDGTELYSGVGEANAIMSVAVTERTNIGSDLTLGSVCANMVEATIFSTKGDLHIAAGSEVALYKVDESGARQKVGLFTMEKPERSSAHKYKITAYDRIARLDKDLTVWLAGLKEWPYPMYTFAQMVCTQCGVSLANESLPCGDYQIRQFSADGITGRQLMQWIGEANAKFCRANADGEVEFAWYTPAAVAIAPTRDANTYGYYQGSLSYSDYSVSKIEKVQIRFSDEDVGVIYPNDTDATNTYAITGNYLLLTDTTDALLPVAQTVYTALKDVTYTPAKVSIQANMDIHAGNIVRITDSNGTQLQIYVMQKKQSGQRDTIECSGSQRRDSVTFVNNQSFQALAGKVLNLRASVEGLKAENKDTEGHLAQLLLQVDEIAALVSQQTTRQDTMEQLLAEIRLLSDSIQFEIQHIRDNGVDKVITKTGFRFDEIGMLVSKLGDEISNLIDNTGVYVRRGDDVMLQANNRGVIATDVTVRNYLIVGHLRFEQMGNGTSVFYV